MLESKTFRICFGAALLLCAISYRQALSAQEVQDSIAKPIGTYRIGVRDRIQVDVWQHPELTHTVAVDGKGNITLPSVHEVQVVGLSATDVAILIRHKLERKIPNPQVTVTVTMLGIRNPLAPKPQPPLRDLPKPQLPLQDLPIPPWPTNASSTNVPPVSSPTQRLQPSKPS
jgi:hypothetical protein